MQGASVTVLGGGGFLGTHLAQLLVSQGAKVTSFGRTVYYPDALSDVQSFEGDLTDLAGLERAIKGADVVFHLAGTSSPSMAEEDRAGDLASSVQSTLSILDLCLKHGVRRLVYASSGGTIYGDAPPPLSETTFPSPISSYGVNKLATEMYVRLYNRMYDMHNVVLRIANPYGPYQHGRKRQGAISVFTRQALRGETIKIWGNGSVVRDYVHAGDVARAFVRAATYNGADDCFNIGSGVGRSLLELIADLKEAIGFDFPVKFLEARKIDVHSSVLDCDLARRELGWMPDREWQSSLAETCDWIRQDLDRIER